MLRRIQSRGRNQLLAAAIIVAAAGGWGLIQAPRVLANALYFDLSLGNFTQDWTNIGLITANDDWSGVPSIIGYRGDDLTTATGTNPQTIVGTSAVVNVIANQTAPNTFATGGVAEFHIANPTIALNGSGTADAPYIQLHLNSTGRKDVTISYNLRDLDGSIDNAVQPVALQFRPTPSGNWTNVPTGFVADATTGPSLATLVTPVSATLPVEANDQPQLQVRVITTNAAGNDEWVGIDDIVVSSTPCAGPCPVPPPPTITQIYEIQGPGRISPKINQVVTTQGVVTARARNGFYLQSVVPDADPLTSEGIFVFTGGMPAPIAAVGDRIQLSGRVTEFSNLGEAAPTITELVDPFAFLTIAAGFGVPAATPIPLADLAPGVEFDRLERYEGMLVAVPQTVVVGPSGERAPNPDGQFYVTLPNLPAPFREPGLEANTQLALNEPVTPNPAPAPVTRFDSNPEVLRIDTDELFAYDNLRTPGITAAVGASVAAFNAVLHFEDRTYNALPVVAAANNVLGLLSNNVLQPVPPVPLPTANQFTVASANLEFFSSSDTNRLTKFVRAMCDVLRAPDILGVIEIDSLPSMTAIANAANVFGGGCTNSVYAAFLSDPDTATQNTGFLIKTTASGNARVTVIDAQRANTIEGGLDPNVIFQTGDRRPYILRATVTGSTSIVPLPVTVILNHPRSLIDSDVPGGTAARQKRLNHALYAAYLIKRLQTENPSVKLALVGDLNAFEFSDGIVDVLGILRGDPVADPTTYVVGDSVDVFGTPSFSDLTNLITLPAFPLSERYSFTFRGDRQALDHALVNPNLQLRNSGFSIAHVNSLYPAFDPATGLRLRDVTTRPEGYSDHDVPVSYFETARLVGRTVTAWLGLKNAGAQFDLRAEVYRNGVLVSSGESRCIADLNRNPNQATEAAVALTPFDADNFTSGTTLSLKLLARIGTNPNGTKCSGPAVNNGNAVGLRVYFDAADRASRLDAATAVPAVPSYYLDSIGANLTLNTTAPTGGKPQFRDSDSLDFDGGNLWKEIGIWTTTLP